MGRREPVDLRVRRPGLGVLVALGAGLGVDVELGHRRGALPDGRAQTVGAGVTAAHDDHVLPGGGHRRALDVPLAHPVGQRQVLHRLVDPGQLPPRHLQLTPRGRPRGDHDRVMASAQLHGAEIPPDRRGRTELGPLGPHLPYAPLQLPLLHLELGDAVPQQSADPVVLLVHRDRVPGPGQLLGRREPRGPRADHRDRPSRQPVRRPGRGETQLPGAVGDGALDVLDGDRGLVDSEHTPRLARRRAQPPGELGEVVGGVQPVGGGPPVLPGHQVVPLGDQIAERTGVVAERYAAVHAPVGLFAHDGQQRPGDIDLVPVPDPLLDRPPGPVLARSGHESLGIGHGRLPCVRSGGARRRTRRRAALFRPRYVSFAPCAFPQVSAST